MFADILYLVAAGVAALLLAGLVSQLLRGSRHALRELADLVAAPFYALVPLSGMLLALGFEPYAHDAAATGFGACLVVAWLFAAWLAGQWIVGRPAAGAIHPGYFLPTVGTGMIGADGLAQFGAPALGWMSFGAGRSAGAVRRRDPAPAAGWHRRCS